MIMQGKENSKMTYHNVVTKKKKTKLGVSFRIFRCLNSPPSLNLLPVPNWLTVKFCYLLTSTKFKILSTFSSSAPIYFNTVSRVVTRTSPHMRPAGFP